MKPLDKTIKIYDGWMSEKDCNMFVKVYKNLEEAGFTAKRRNYNEVDKESIAEDTQVALHEAIYENGEHQIPYGAILSKTFVESYFKGPHEDYMRNFSILKNHDYHTIKYLKIQKQCQAKAIIVGTLKMEVRNGTKDCLHLPYI